MEGRAPDGMLCAPKLSTCSRHRKKGDRIAELHLGDSSDVTLVNEEGNRTYMFYGSVLPAFARSARSSNTTLFSA
jgi:hypothetical protein